MNAVLDVLKLRQVKLDYISPPVCQIFAGSGSGAGSISVEANYGPETPTARLSSGFIVWDPAPGLVCTSIYLDQSNGTASPVVECIPPKVVVVCSPGWFYVTTTDASGNESPRTDFVFSSGTQQVSIAIPARPGDVIFTLYKNSDASTSEGTYLPVLSGPSFGGFEICSDAGCYRIQSITDSGGSDLGQPICQCFDSSSRLPDAALGASYSQRIAPSDNAVLPIEFTLVDGALPPGLVLSNSGEVSGTPTLAGTFDWKVVAVDSQGMACVVNLTLVTYLVIPPLVCDDQTQAMGVKGVAYSEQLSASGGVFPYTFSLAVGSSLPPGLALSSDGILSGAPTKTGVFGFAVDVTDANNSICSFLVGLTNRAVGTALIQGGGGIYNLYCGGLLSVELVGVGTQVGGSATGFACYIYIPGWNVPVWDGLVYTLNIQGVCGSGQSWQVTCAGVAPPAGFTTTDNPALSISESPEKYPLYYDDGVTPQPNASGPTTITITFHES